MDPALRSAIEAIHASPVRVVYEFSGAGALALFWLHGVAGSSRTVLEASDRYSPAAMIDLLGATPGSFASVETSSAMARRALDRASALHDGPCMGVALTASIATDREKRGDHQGFVATLEGSVGATYALVLEKGARDRLSEEDVLSRLVIRAIAERCAPDVEVPVPLRPGDSLSLSQVGTD